MPSKPDPSPIALRWEELTFAEGVDRAHQVPEWRELYARCFIADVWSVSLFDANVVTMLGMSVLLASGAYGEAVKVSERFILHKESSALDAASWTERHGRWGQALILMGRIDEGLAKIRLIFDSEDSFIVRLRPYMVRDYIIGLCSGDLGDPKPALEGLQQLAHDILIAWPEQAEKAPLALDIESPAELVRLLESTYPPRSEVKGPGDAEYG